MSLHATGHVVSKEKHRIRTKGEIQFENRTLLKAEGVYVIPPARVVMNVLGMSKDDLPNDIKPYLKGYTE